MSHLVDAGVIWFNLLVFNEFQCSLRRIAARQWKAFERPVEDPA